MTGAAQTDLVAPHQRKAKARRTCASEMPAPRSSLLGPGRANQRAVGVFRWDAQRRRAETDSGWQLLPVGVNAAS